MNHKFKHKCNVFKMCIVIFFLNILLKEYKMIMTKAVIGNLKLTVTSYKRGRKLEGKR